MYKNVGALGSLFKGNLILFLGKRSSGPLGKK